MLDHRPRRRRPPAAGMALVCTTLLAAGFVRAAPTAYVLDAAHSRLDFTASQAGAEFPGAFKTFSAVIAFSPQDLAGSHFDVDIDLASVDTQDKDRDQTLRGADFFDVIHYAKGHYAVRGFNAVGKSFSGSGTLTLRGVIRKVPIEFTFATAASGASLEGTATLRRLEFGVGQGDWKSTEMVGDEVKIHFALRLRASPAATPPCKDAPCKKPSGTSKT